MICALFYVPLAFSLTSQVYHTSAACTDRQTHPILFWRMDRQTEGRRTIEHQREEVINFTTPFCISPFLQASRGSDNPYFIGWVRFSWGWIVGAVVGMEEASVVVLSAGKMVFGAVVDGDKGIFSQSKGDSALAPKEVDTLISPSTPSSSYSSSSSSSFPHDRPSCPYFPALRECLNVHFNVCPPFLESAEPSSIFRA